MRSTAALILGGSQGLLGWYMVKSGLVDQPHVSHFRLAAHLSLAFICGQWVWSMLIDLNLKRAREWFGESASNQMGSTGLHLPSVKAQGGYFALLIIQIVYGAFMAGSRAGYLYTTYPTMNGAWIAPTWFNESGSFIAPSLSNLINHPDSIHFIHRTLALAVLAVGAWVGLRFFQSSIRIERVIGIALLSTLCFQFLLGVLTVVSGMNIAIAAAHQGGSFILLSSTIVTLQYSWRKS